MKKVTINELVRKANEAGYKTYLKSTSTVRFYGDEEDTTIYTLAGQSWETPFRVKESEIADEYEVFTKIVEKRATK